MKKNEMELMQELGRMGFPAELVRSRVDWAEIRKGGASSKEEISRRLITTAFALPGLADIGEVPGWVFDVLKFIFDKIFPPPPPRPETFTAADEDIEWCQSVKLGELNEGDYATIEVTSNGGTFPGDTEGTVEVSK